MSNTSNKKPASSKVDSDSKVTIEHAPTRQQQSTTLAKLLLASCLLLSLLALAGVGYLWQQDKIAQQAQLNQWQGINQKLDETVSQQRSQIAGFKQLLQTEGSQQQQLLEQLAQLQRQLQMQQQQIQQLSTTDREDWLLAEAEYLMKLAHQRLLMAKDISGAQQLMEAADSILRDLNDRSLQSVRTLLAKEIVALKTAGQLDSDGLYLQLDALKEQLQDLRIFELPNLKMAEEPAILINDWQQRIEQGFKQALEKLSQHIQITRRDEVYKPLMAPEHEAAIRNNLQLMLEQAQTALLLGKQNVYETSLTKAKQWLETFYALKPEEMKRYLTLIEEYRQQIVVATLPDISASSKALKTYIETHHQLAEKTKNETLSDPMAADAAGDNL